jgi:hypothetical protein
MRLRGSESETGSFFPTVDHVGSVNPDIGGMPHADKAYGRDEREEEAAKGRINML